MSLSFFKEFPDSQGGGGVSPRAPELLDQPRELGCGDLSFVSPVETAGGRMIPQGYLQKKGLGVYRYTGIPFLLIVSGQKLTSCNLKKKGWAVQIDSFSFTHGVL